MNKALNLLSICRRAGMLELGMDPVKDACRNQKAKGVLVSSDISAKSLKEIKFVCCQEGIVIFQLDATMEDCWAALGKKVAILGVCDRGFMKKLSTMLEEIENKQE